MTFLWLKRYMPRRLYGRAALILVLPVVTLQLVVSVVFVQRHFEGVTEQRSRELARTLTLALTEDGLAPALGIALRPAGVVPERDRRRWYDLTGIIVSRTLYDRLPGLQRVMMPDDRVLVLYVLYEGMTWRAQVSRERASPANAHQLFVNMVVFGALMTTVAFIYLRNQLRPITRMAEAAEAFGRGKVIPYTPSGAVEVRSAGAAFLEMRARIERHIEQRTLMLSGVSHDLRTPITRLRLGLSMLEADDREPLERDVEDMQVLIDAFLDFARGESESGLTESTDPLALLETVIADAQRSGQPVSLVEHSGSGTMDLRPRAMRRAVENLVGNAVRYGTRCEVSVVLSDGSLRIRVEDDGPGIPAESRERALRPFVRLDPARNQDRGSGVGLGLAIAADIARAHGGILRLGESERLGGLRADLVLAR